jgi:branched-chain amino acid transport system substrate-binding protein
MANRATAHGRPRRSTTGRWSLRRTLGLGVAIAAALAIVVAGGAGAATKSKLPGVVHIPVVMSLTGAAGLPGSALAAGMQFAVTQLNQQKFLGKTKVVLDVNDDQTDVNRATQLVTSVVNSHPPGFLGPGVSALALTTAPIAENAKIPYIATEAVNSGLNPLLVRGDYIYRLTPPEYGYQTIVVNYLKKKGIKSAMLLYISQGAAQEQWAAATMPPLLKGAGINLTDTVPFSQTQTDFSALATRIAQENPDAVGIASFSSQNPTLFTQIRQAGYKGLLFGEGSLGGNSLVAAGDNANGAVWASDYAPFMKAKSTVAFTKAWEKANNGTAPVNFDAEGYDGAKFLIEAIKKANSIDPAKVDAALEALTKVPYYGAIGKVTFHGTHDAASQGVLNLWENGQPTNAF